MVWCGVMWCGVVWCGVVWCGVMWCGVLCCGVMWCGATYCLIIGYLCHHLTEKTLFEQQKEEMAKLAEVCDEEKDDKNDDGI